LYHYLCQTIVPNIRSFVLAAFNGIGLTNAKQKTPSSLGLLGRYDGNILGGCMIGLGMTLTGACPGTVLVPLSIGTRSRWYVMAGGVLVDILHTRILSLRKNDTNSSYDTNLTVYGRLGVKSQYATLVYGLFCVVLICAVSVLGPNEAFILLATIVGGALIGAAQAASLILTGAPVGVSTGYGVLGSYFWRTWESLSGQKSGKPPAPLNSVVFVAGIAVGSYAFALLSSSIRFETVADISPIRGTIGGLIMVLGTRLAGGCTSRHGISGMFMLGVSSLITFTFMFISGFGAAFFI
jgi:uncharacterized membrane protein YedE/YeeE